MEREKGRGRVNSSNNGGSSELRRPLGNVSGTDGNSFSPAGVGNNTQNSAPQLNAMPTSASSNTADYSLSMPRADHCSFEYAFSSEAVNVPVKAQTNTRLDPRLNEAIKNSKLSPLAKEFVPKTFVQGEAPTPSGSTTPSQLEYVVRLVQEFIYEVTMNPGKFEEEVILLTETLNVMVKSADLTKALVEIIFKEAIHEPNFRYNGARLCNHLNRNLMALSEPKGLNFRFFLLEKCQFEFEQRDMLIKNDPNHLRGLIFFLGELYSQILQPSGGRLEVLQTAIVSLMDTLLSQPSQENVKCVCQVMKMTGANLDDDEKIADRKRDGTSLDNIFGRLGELHSTGAARDLASMVSNVIQLRSINWGRSNNTPIETQPPPPQVFSGGPVFYGPDGQPFTPEEELFLETQTQAFYDCRFDSYDEDFNDEIAADYESFLREMGQ